MKVGDKLYCKKSWADFLINDKIYELEIYNDTEIGVSIGNGQFINLSNGLGSFIDHFYTEKEIRKLKLEALESRR